MYNYDLGGGFDYDLGGGIRYDREEYRTKILRQDGGHGSGNFGHSGRKGKVGGSGKGGGATKKSGNTVKVRAEAFEKLKNHGIIKSVKSTEDAKNVLAKKGFGKVEIDNLDSTAAAHAAAGLVDMKERFPDIDIGKVSCEVKDKSAFGEYHPDLSEIGLNHRKLNKEHEQAYITAVHEYAHAVDDYLGFRLKSSLGVKNNGYNEQVIKNALKNIGASKAKDKENFKLKLGGTKHWKKDYELLAIAFEKEMLGIPDSFAEEIVRIVEEDYHDLHP